MKSFKTLLAEAILKTDKFEVWIHRNKYGDDTHDHYHKKSTEINVIIKGKMIVNGKELLTGDIFVFEPYVVSEAEFISDTDLIVVRDASNTTDKYKES